ncbi:butyrate kinase [candidate division LCP-89 bacterium B3_LCP]|uniref:Probable butyrate kinase n=1 Tax=candidate division LCP-89 bacterium B3_LCP TaxID=2012998 RepID=A0A532UYQ8_UNCL8|nr:MAG: butyrate kinase [candidate division LCP-89 bacterium B3_LCP]
MNEAVLVVNPGSTSTKTAVWTPDGVVFQRTIRHLSDQLAKFPLIVDQFDLRLGAVRETVGKWLTVDKLAAVVGRGGPLRPLEGGTYLINDKMLEDLRNARYSNHASNLGAIISHHLASELEIPCFVVDPVTVDEFTPLARVSGLPEIERKCRSHALNIKAVSRRAAVMLNKSLEETNFAVAHMGGGLSICALKGGKIVDVNDALLGMGPFSPERAGAMPIGGLVELCYSGEYTKEQIIHRLSHESGLKAYLGESDLVEIEKRIDEGDEKAKLYYEAMLYQVAKEIGAMAAVLRGNLDGVILTGGMVNSPRLVEIIKSYVSFLGRIFTFPGEMEMEALAQGTFRVLQGKEEAKIY